MIPVAQAVEPVGFDAAVRQPGLKWLRKHKVPLRKRLASGIELHPYWRACMPDLHKSYDGICAYLCVFLERATGGATADHFVPKSRRVALAYEWTNYRLACSKMNARKRDFETALDPFALAPSTFRLELVTGRVYVNPALSAVGSMKAEQTIDLLDLDGPEAREMRARHYEGYRQGDYTGSYLKRRSPFVWSEADRQGLL